MPPKFPPLPPLFRKSHFSVMQTKLSASAIQSNRDKSPTKSESCSAETKRCSESQRFLFFLSCERKDPCRLQSEAAKKKKKKKKKLDVTEKKELTA